MAARSVAAEDRTAHAIFSGRPPGMQHAFNRKVDMAVWGWARALPFILGPDAWAKLPNLKRHFDGINARPAAQRAEALKSRFSFKAEIDEDARKHLFPQNARLTGY